MIALRGLEYMCLGHIIQLCFPIVLSNQKSRENKKGERKE